MKTALTKRSTIDNQVSDGEAIMDLFELENLEAIRVALVLVGLLGALDLAIGHLSGSAMVVPCALGAVVIRAYQEGSSNQKRRSELHD